MAEYKIPYQNLTFQIPDIGEVFRLSNNIDPSGRSLFKREGNTVYSYSLNNLLKTPEAVQAANAYQSTLGISPNNQKQFFYDPNIGVAWKDENGRTRNLSEALGEDANTAVAQNLLKSLYGIDYNSIGQKNYIDMTAVFGRMPGFNMAQGNIGMFKTATPTVSDSFTQTVSPTNPFGKDITNTTTGQPVYTETPYVPGGINTGGTYYNQAGQVLQKGGTIMPQITAPTTNLKFGDTGSEVQKLQDYLVASGYMTQADMDTGPGVFGPRTKAAVAKLQNALGIQAGSSAGIYGPATRQAILNGAPNQSASPINVSGATGASPSPVQVNPPPTGGTYTISTGGLYSPQQTTGTPTIDQLYQQYLGALPQPPSTADAYRQAQGESGIATAEANVTTQTAEYNAAKKNVALYQAELQEIIDRGRVKALEQEGKPVTMDTIQRSQAEITRQAAIEAIPTQAKILAAQAIMAAEQGDVELANQTLAMAQDKLNTVFKLKSEDATNLYNWRKNALDKAWEVATANQKMLLEDKQRIDDRNFQIQRDNQNYAQSLANYAIENGQANIGAAIAKLDSSSPDYMQKVSALAGQIRPKGVGTTTGGTTTGGKTTGGEVISPYQAERQFRTIQSVDELSILARQNPGIFGRTAALWIPDWLRSKAFRDFRAQLDTLKSSITFGELTAMREASKTGGALGQVSDVENRLLSSSLGALDMSQSPESFVKQLAKIKESIIRWQSAVNQYGGQNELPTITAPDGTQVIITD